MLVFKGKMKFRTASPKCTYSTSEFKAELVIKGNVETSGEKPMTFKGERILGESESGCEPTRTVSATGILYWEKPSLGTHIYYAIRKGEK